MREVKFNCSICLGQCGFRATVDGDRIVEMLPDPTHPASRGYTCPKGRATPITHHSPDRLDRPRIDGVDVSWDEWLDDIGPKFQRAIDAGGPNSVASFIGKVGDGVGTFFDLLGTKARFSSLTLDIAPMFRATELVTGFAHVNPVWAPDQAGTLAVLWGINPSITCGYVGTGASNWPKRLQDFRDSGGELWAVDPKRTKSTEFADRHLTPRPGTDVFVLGYLVRELLESGHNADEVAAACDPADIDKLRAAVADFSLEAAADRTGIAAQDIADLLAAIRRHQQVAMVCGTGLGFGPHGILAQWLVWAVLILTGSADREGGMKFHPMSRGDLDAPPMEGHAPPEGSHTPGPESRPDLPGFLGEYPAVTLADEIEAGNVKVLVLYGSSPLTSIPQPDRLREAFKKLDVLLVMDIFDNELTGLATHVAPCTWFTEGARFLHGPFLGTLRSTYSPALVEPAADRKHPWWILAQIGRRIGIDTLYGLDADTVDDETVVRHLNTGAGGGAGSEGLFSVSNVDFADELIAAGPHGMDIPYRHGWLHEKVLPGGRWRIAPQVLVDRLPRVWETRADQPHLVCGRIMKKLNLTPWALPESGNVPPPIQVSPDIAETRLIGNGDRVRVSTSFGSVEGWAEINPSLTAQTVWINHGWLEQNVNNLIDPTPDPLTAQPIMTSVPVEVERLAGPDSSEPLELAAATAGGYAR